MVVVVYNLQGVNTVQLSLEQIALMYLGNISYWNDNSIKETNPGVTFPSVSVSPVVRITDGTATGVFTAALSNGSQLWHDNYPIFTNPQMTVVNRSLYSPEWPQHYIEFYGYRGTGVTVTVQTVPGSIGYEKEYLCMWTCNMMSPTSALSLVIL